MKNSTAVSTTSIFNTTNSITSIFFALLVCIISFSSCQKESLTDLEMQTTKTSNNHSDEGMSEFDALESISTLSIKDAKVLSLDKDNQEKGNVLISLPFNTDFGVDADNWDLYSIRKSELPNHLAHKIVARLQKYNGTADLYIWAYDDSRVEPFRLVRFDNSSSDALSTSFRASDLMANEEYAVVGVYGRSYATYNIDIQEKEVDCMEFPPIDQHILNNYQLVCACDGTTYNNPSLAEKAGLTSWTIGACGNTPPNGCNNVPSNCSLVSCIPNPPSFYEGYYSCVIDCNFSTDFEIDRWEVDGYTMTGTSNTANFTIHHPGTIQVCGYYKCGNQVYQCCEEVICPPYGGGNNGGSTACCSDEDIASWLPARVAQITATYGCAPEVECCTLNGSKVIDILPPYCVGDAQGFIYTCEGTFISHYQGFAGEPRPNVYNCNSVTVPNGGGECTLFNDDFEVKQIGARIDYYTEWRQNNGVTGRGGQLVDTQNAGIAVKLDNTSGVQESALFEVNANESTSYELSFRIYTSTSANARIFLYSQNNTVMTQLLFETSTYKGRWVDVKYSIDQLNNTADLFLEGQYIRTISFGSNDTLNKVSFHTKADGKAYKFYIDNCKVKKEHCNYAN